MQNPNPNHSKTIEEQWRLKEYNLEFEKSKQDPHQNNESVGRQKRETSSGCLEITEVKNKRRTDGLPTHEHLTGPEILKQIKENKKLIRSITFR